MSIDIDVDIADVKHMLAQVRRRYTHEGLRGFLEGDVVPYIEGTIEHRFENEGDTLTRAWKPLKDKTNEWRRKYGFPEAHPINVRTGELFDYVMSSKVTVATGIAQVSFPAYEAGGNLATKFMTAQQGKAKPRTPKRPVLAFGKRDEKKIESLLLKWVELKGQMPGPFAR